VTERAAAVRALLAGQRHGVLATLSARHGGWPYASVAPYALTDAHEPLLLLSQLAEHTRNIQADNRVSLFVQADGPEEDPQAGARVTLLGWVAPVGKAERADWARLHDRYVDWHPSAADYFQMSDFGLYVLRVETARFVGGFGDMGWLDAAALRID
jgi:putative heme iron utilization protein